MGFFKRFLSLGSSKSKKNKKKQNTVLAKEAVDAEGRILPRELVPQDPDTSMNRLLRSSSTKFSVMSAIDYASLPPLPLPTGATPSTPSLSPSPSMLTVATTPGVQRTGTYVVKVHGRTTLSRTEFPRANPPPSPTKQRQAPEPKTPRQDRHDQYDDDNDDNNDDAARGPRIKEVNFTPKDNSRIYALRQDPSVVSLLKMYDDQGCLDVHAFASTPPTPAPISTEFEGREPRPRTGSTLRQLLGEPQPAFMTNNTTEGDISWAERFLDEQLNDDSPLSSPASVALETPRDALFPDNLSAPLVAPGDTTLSSHDADSSINYPAISSMEVEVSGTEEDVLPEVAPVSKPKPTVEPKTPQRASEVFGFLNRRNTVTIKERDLPELPPASPLDNTGTNHDDLIHDVGTQDTSPESPLQNDATHSANTSHSASNTSSETPSHFSHAQIHTATMTKLSSAFASSTLSLNLLVSNDETSAPTADPQPSTTADVDDAGELPLHATSAPTDVPVPTTFTGSSASTTTRAAHHHTGSSASSGSSSRLPPSRIPRGPRPRPLSTGRREDIDFAEPKNLTTAASKSDQPFESASTTTANMSRSAKREAFTNIPQRQHRRITSRSSEAPNDAERTSASKSSAPAIPTNPRKRSTKPAHRDLARTLDKENTPSPPRAASPGPAAAARYATPVRARTLVGHLLEREDAYTQGPPSPASSSELSPVAQDMMSNLRMQRMRARQVERRKGMWVRE